MANRLKMAMVDTVQRLLEQGWSYRRIARELGIHRDTVAGLAGKSKPAKAPLGADDGNGPSKPAKNRAEKNEPARKSKGSRSAWTK